MTRHRPTTLAVPAAVGGLLLVAFLTTSGDLTGPPTQTPTSWTDAALILLGGAALAWSIVTAPRRRDAGGGALGRGAALTVWLFGALALLTALSIAWSVAPDQSWEESGRTLAYLAVFGLAAFSARASRAGSARALGAITTAAVALCLWALAVKVFNLPFSGQPNYGRLLAPFGYWNATGLTGALALPGCIWLAAAGPSPTGPSPAGPSPAGPSPADPRPTRIEPRLLLTGLGSAGVALTVSVVVLSYSRSAAAAALAAAVIPIVFLRARRRAIVMGLVGLAGAAPTVAFALINHNIADDGPKSLYGATPHSGTLHRAGPELLLGAITLAALLLTALAAVRLRQRLNTRPASPALLRRFDRTVLTVVGAVPTAIVLWLLLNARGPFGEISQLWHQLTKTNARVGDGAARLTSIASSRSVYWRQAIAIGTHHLLAGTGAGTFFPAYLRYHQALLSPLGEGAHHAHSYLLDTLASFGLIGVAVVLALFSSWCRDVRRALGHVGLHPRERDARWAIVGIVIAFGVSSALDWTWFYPGVAVPALAAAGWLSGLAGRPPAGHQPPEPLSTRPGAILALTALAALTLVAAWASLAPMRSTNSVDASYRAQEQGATGAALADARAAVSEDPLSVNALSRLATVYGAIGDPAQQRAELIRALHVQPENPQPYEQYGIFLICHGAFSSAVAPLRRANRLDITNSQSQRQLLIAALVHNKPVPVCGPQP
ncbi:O-antigen ligase family protein [Conexibacter sp. DBS9H8]|uniref:O-antigen ligase family protein n=1 Tax=Conexibacter sp. DBS9H8 TaxID=2937801 RepID=UPI00200C9976|nr:O-antigen ligase family protein [Conexibacter sp. DBS9H8]